VNLQEHILKKKKKARDLVLFSLLSRDTLLFLFDESKEFCWFDVGENIGNEEFYPFDLSSWSLFLSRFIRSRRPTPLLAPSLVLLPPHSA
jgi:hypothetical protein